MPFALWLGDMISKNVQVVLDLQMVTYQLFKVKRDPPKGIYDPNLKLQWMPPQS